MDDLRRHEVRELARLTAGLEPAQLMFFQAEYGRHRRNPTTALLLCTLLGGFGAHYFYFGRHRGGIIRLLLCWTLVPTIVSLFEARTMTARALRYNASLANEIVLALHGAVEDRPGAVSTVVEARPLAGVPRDVAAAAVAEAALIAAAPAPAVTLTPGPGTSPPAPLPRGEGRAEAAFAATPVAPEPPAPTAPWPAPSAPWPASAVAAPAAAPAPSPWPGLETGRALQAGVSATPAPAPVPDTEPEPEAVPWFLTDARPAVAVAAATAAAAWGAPSHPLSPAPAETFPGARADGAAWPWGAPPAPEPEPARAAAADESESREPVFMYQVAPASRPAPVRYGPPPAAPPPEAWPPAAPAPRPRGDDGLAVLGPALAVGLADLLRERRDTPRTHPFADSAATAAPAAPAYPAATDRAGAPAARPAASVTSADEAAASAALASLLGVGPSVGPSLAPRPSVAAPAAVLVPPAAGPAADPTPAGYAARTSGARRRRTVQRVIVRKLAMRDGRVLAESTVERQVPLFGDEAEIDARVQAATDEAAHAALLDLMGRVPVDAMPAIRDQLRSLERAVAAVGSR